MIVSGNLGTSGRTRPIARRIDALTLRVLARDVSQNCPNWEGNHPADAGLDGSRGTA